MQDSCLTNIRKATDSNDMQIVFVLCMKEKKNNYSFENLK